MPAQAFIGSTGSGHLSWPPTPVISGSNNCFVNSKPAARVGDPLVPHPSPSPSPPHPRSISEGSSSVFINNKAAARIGDPIDCGGFITDGSNNVVTGG